jgi:argininosuccinate lyase
MPQKRNPDAAELIRAKAARITANFSALSAIVQKTALAYAKDFQEDKSLTFEAFDAFELSVVAMTGMVSSMTFNRAAMRDAATRGYSTATDLADWLVRELKVPFREAHEITGKIVKVAEDMGVPELNALPLKIAQSVEPRITEAALEALSVERSVESRASYGGTAPVRVREQVARWRQQLGE